jgi:hypothetical protein
MIEINMVAFHSACGGYAALQIGQRGAAKVRHCSAWLPRIGRTDSRKLNQRLTPL